MAKDEGAEVEGMQGYRYFGAAKRLKGVAELLKPHEEPKEKINREELMKLTDADYYGYRDDDDGVLATLEAEEEVKARLLEIKGWEERNAGVQDMDESSSEDDVDSMDFSSVVPSKEDMQQILLEKQKEEVLRNYLTPALQRAILAEKQN